MPIIKSAQKKMRQDVERTKRNKQYLKRMSESLKKAKKSKKDDDVKKAYSALDKAVKKRVIHKNKANRLKSRIAKTVKRS